MEATRAAPTGQAGGQQSRVPEPDAPSDGLADGLAALSRGEAGAVARVLPLVYARLKVMAADRMKRERHGHTLQPTALVHEAFVKLRESGVAWENEAHFFAVAARAMRQVLIDHARARGRDKRGGDADRFRIEDADIPAPAARGEVDLLDLDAALARLAAHDELAARIVEMRFFAGMEVQIIAEALGISDRTVRRHWVYAKAWLARDMAGESAAEGSGP